jgi:hypothetical protein
MNRTHYVILEDGVEVRKFPLKSWIRKNRNELSIPIDPDRQTSHDIRTKLKQQGWRIIISERIVFAIRPNASGNTSYADTFVLALEKDVSENDLLMGTMGKDFFLFPVERDLNTAIRKNIQSLEEGLQIVDDHFELITPAGRIDITAQDTLGNLVVIELKCGIADLSAVGQILSYINALKAEKKQNVRGILIASGFPEKVKYAIRGISNLKLLKYRYNFIFDSVELR